MKHIILFLVLLTLILNACSPSTITSSSGEPPTAVVETVAPEPEDFETRVQAALTQPDAGKLQGLMGETFLIALWQSEGVSYQPGEAVRQLLANHIGPGSDIAFHTFQDMPGFDPQMMTGPDVDLAEIIFVTGWGLEGEGEALLMVARRPDESLYWHSVLVAPQGFAPQPAAIRLMW